jgi:phosphoserine phosphatase RsbU/P
VRILGHDYEIRAVLKAKPKTSRYFDGYERRYLAGVAWQIQHRAKAFKEREEEQEFEACLAELRSILPKGAPEPRGFSLGGGWRAGGPVRGDYYDFFNLDDAKIALIVADMPGRGQPAVALAKSLQTIVKTHTEADVSPSEVCVRINQEVCRSFAPGTLIRFCYGVLDTACRQISFSNAGHHPPYLVRRNGGCYQFDAGGPPLGAFPDAAYDEALLDLVPGDRLAVYTDGLVCAGEHRGEDQQFGAERLIDILRKHPLSDANDLRSLVMSELERFGLLRDDAALLTVTVR